MPISGFIERVPTMHEHDGHHCCELVLAHTIYSELDEDWHRAFFTVRVWDELALGVPVIGSPKRKAEVPRSVSAPV
jgi:hypothetical protein